MYASGALSRQSVPVTHEGHRLMRELLDELTGPGRAEATARLRDARGDGDSPADNPELMDALEEQMRLERRIAELESMRRTLATLARRCHGDRRPDCPILDDLAGPGAA